MGVITLKLDDSLERKLRDRAAHIYGLTRGSLSRAVEDALSLWLRSGPPPIRGSTPVRYSAFRNGKSVLHADSLRQLAEGLKKAGIDARDVELRSSVEVPTTEKLGLPVTRRSK